MQGSFLLIFLATGVLLTVILGLRSDLRSNGRQDLRDFHKSAKKELAAFLEWKEKEGLTMVPRWTAQAWFSSAAKIETYDSVIRVNLKAQMIRLRISSCPEVTTASLKELADEALRPGVRLGREKLWPLDCEGPLPTTARFAQQNVGLNLPEEAPYVVYSSDDGYRHVNLTNVDRDEKWFAKQSRRFHYMKDLLAEEMVNLDPPEERPVVNFTLGLPARVTDLPHVYRSLSSLHSFTTLPAETVLAVSGVHTPEHFAIIRALVDILDDVFPAVPGKKIVVTSGIGSAGIGREMAINVSKLPFYTTFDADDFMHPLWFEYHNQLFKSTPEIDGVFVTSIRLARDTCDLRAGAETILHFLGRVDAFDVVGARSRLEPEKRIRSPDRLRSLFRLYRLFWYLGNTEAEPKLDPATRVLDWWPPVANGWSTMRRVVYETVGIDRMTHMGEDTITNYREVISGFDILHLNRPQFGAYGYMDKKLCSTKSDDELLDHDAPRPHDWIPPP